MKLIIALLAIPFSVWSSALGPEFSITSPVVEAPEEEVTPNSIVDTSNEGVVSIGDMADKSKSFGSRPWQAPNYADQKNILGYDSNTFQIPVGLEKQVKFWVDIFSKYTTEQGVLHDSRYIDVVYREIDFNQIPGFTKMSPVAQNRAKKNEVKRLRKEVEEQLKRLANEKDESKLSEADLKVWKAFASIQEPNKFKEASARGRLRFQLGLKDRFVQGIYYSGRYLEEMERIFQEAGLPKELTRVPFVESSFNIKAKSKVGASGIWQFMRHTGRSYMKVNHLVDERNEPLIATRAATRLLTFNYNLLQNWPLAVTAYNFGPSGMKREKDKHKTDNLVEIAQLSTNRRFGFASTNFYASFLAALEVEKNANKYFGPVEWSDPIKSEVFVTEKELKFKKLSMVFDENQDQVLLFNPHLSKVLRTQNSSIPKGTKLNIPVGSRERLLAFDDKSQAASRNPAVGQ